MFLLQSSSYELYLLFHYFHFINVLDIFEAVSYDIFSFWMRIKENNSNLL